MRKWRVKLPDGRDFELESNDPGRELLRQGHTAFALEEIVPPAVPVQEIPPSGRLTLNVGEAAELLGLSKCAVYNLIHRADFPSLKVGGRRLISRELLADWVKAQAGGAVGE